MTDVHADLPSARNAALSTTDWAALAECRGQDPNLFFPSGNAARVRLQTEWAKAICGRCPVVRECLRAAIEDGAEFGVWGGMTETERARPRAHRSRRASRARS